MRPKERRILIQVAGEERRGAGYLRTQGEIERDIGEIGFALLTIVRPGLLGGARSGWPKTWARSPLASSVRCCRALAHQLAGA